MTFFDFMIMIMIMVIIYDYRQQQSLHPHSTICLPSRARAHMPGSRREYCAPSGSVSQNGPGLTEPAGSGHTRQRAPGLAEHYSLGAFSESSLRPQRVELAQWDRALAG
jgi:hypothetical protein